MDSKFKFRRKPQPPSLFPQLRASSRKLTRLLITVFLFLSFLVLLRRSSNPTPSFNYVVIPIRPERYPVPPKSLLRLPRHRPKNIPKIQHAPLPETVAEKRKRVARLQEVKDAFLHSWKGYKQQAWGKDELRPIEGGFKTPFCGWAATMVDSLDTLWIMGLREEFEISLVELSNVDFTNTEGCMINLFETTIRHLGGMLAAFDVSGGRYTVLVEKAVELAEVLITAFDTPNRMPSPHYLWSAIDDNSHEHVPSHSVVLAVLGSLQLEFTRLAQITGNDKYFDAVQRVMNELEKWQDNTILPGMWPAMVDSMRYNQSCLLGSPYVGVEETFTLGSLADSAYEYLPKQYMMLGGQMKSYRSMYEKFIPVAKKHLMFRPMTVTDEDILMFGTAKLLEGGQPWLIPELQHLTCFTGGMLAIAGRIFNRPEDVEDGAKLADGCIWAYRNTVTGIMPEAFTAIPCENRTSCKWDKQEWYKAIDARANESEIRETIVMNKLSPGFVHIQDGRYLLRPEAIESVFILYRITGDQYWVDSGWDMFKSIQAQTETKLAHSAIDNVLNGAPNQVDEMESFWLAETLKYFYLLFSETNVVNLDEYVLNTEAHPLKRPK